MKFAYVLARLTGAPWFITEDALVRITDLLESRMANGAITPPILPSEDDDPDSDDLPAQVPGIGIIPINGVLGQHMSLMEKACGGCDYADIVAEARMYANDPSINMVVMHFLNSPGGTASGCPEAFAALNEIKTESKKPFVSVVTGMACSAAYYLAASADTILSTESAMIGSIGTMRGVQDNSEANAKAGIKRFVIKSASMKDIGNPDRAMTPDETTVLQAMTDHLGGIFKRDMLSARPVIAAEVFATGLPYYAADAMKLGLIDAIAPNLETVLASIASPQS